MKKHFPKNQNGFALPTVMILGLAILILTLSIVSFSTAVRLNLENNYYNKLATEAAQSGANYAAQCFIENGYFQPWSPAASKPLTQTTDCKGDPITPAIASIVTKPGVVSTFSVEDVNGRTDGATIITSTGKVTKGGRNYTKVVKEVVRSPQIRQNNLTFGYYFNIGNGAFFSTIGHDGNVRAAGKNEYGQLGNGSLDNTTIPQIYNLPTGKTASKTYTNFLSQGYQLYVKTTEGDIYGAGMGDYGQLGNGLLEQKNPNPQLFQLPAGEKGVYVGPLGYATFVLTDKNNIYAAGSCDRGQLGIGTCSGTNQPNPTRVQLPAPDSSDANTIPTDQIVGDANTVYALMQGGRLYGWGNNAYGQLANNSTTASNVPVQIGNFGDSGYPKVKQIAFDGDTIYILDNNGKAWAAGRNHFGQMGYPPGGNYLTIQPVPINSGAGTVEQITTDQWFASFRTSKGDIYSAGINDCGQLGDGTMTPSTDGLVKFRLPGNIKATYVYTASLGKRDSNTNNNTFVIGSDNRVYGAGANTYGQLGIGNNTPCIADPQPMQLFDGANYKAVQVMTGFGSTIVLSDINKVYSVGRNSYGQLGNGSTVDTNTPSQASYLQGDAATYIF